MIIHQPHLCTKIPIWSPKYSTQYGSEGEWVVLLSKFKVHHGSPVLIITFTKAPHLAGGRFAIRRSDVEKCPVVTNGKIDCYSVNMSKLETWDSAQEARDMAFGAFDD